jgi:small subunit ribosomal protein S8
MLTDPISDMLTRIRNANANHSDKVSMPSSKLKKEIADILLKEGYFKDVKVEGEKGKKNLVLTLKYAPNGDRVISDLKRISKPGMRVYAEVEQLPEVLNGLGIAIISTSKGLLTDKEARAQKVGGEVIAYVW